MPSLNFLPSIYFSFLNYFVSFSTLWSSFSGKVTLSLPELFMKNFSTLSYLSIYLYMYKSDIIEISAIKKSTFPPVSWTIWMYLTCPEKLFRQFKSIILQQVDLTELRSNSSRKYFCPNSFHSWDLSFHIVLAENPGVPNRLNLLSFLPFVLG